MSDQTTREAAARAWFAEPNKDTYSRLYTAMWIDALRGFYTPISGSSMEWRSALSLWLAWAKADAAKAAPTREADAPEGICWIAPERLIDYVGACGEQDAPASFGVSPTYLATVARFGSLWDPDNPAIAHARAQLAREASAAPTQPAALTLEQARAMCREAGDTMVTASGYEDPAVTLAWLEAHNVAERAANARSDVYDRVPEHDRKWWRGQAAQGETVTDEIARLRALGVTPAVLS